MKIREMTNDKVLLKPIEDPKVSRGGLALPDNYRDDRSRRGVVLMVGPGQRDMKGVRRPPVVQPGDIAVLDHRRQVMEVEAEFAGTLMTLWVCRESDILAIEPSDV